MTSLRVIYSEAEVTAIELAFGVLLVSAIDEKASVDVFGCPVPGMRTFLKLQREGLLIITDEDPVYIDSVEFTFTPSVELSDLGRAVRTWLRSCDNADLELARSLKAIGQEVENSNLQPTCDDNHTPCS